MYKIEYSNLFLSYLHHLAESGIQVFTVQPNCKVPGYI